MHYLKLCLTGEAGTLINSLPAEETYDSAWTTLAMRYDNKRMQISTLLNKLFALPDVTPDNIGKLKELRDNLHFVMNSLSNVGCDTTTWDPIVVHTVLQKLNTTLRRDWENKQGEKTDYPTLAAFKTFLDSKINALAAITLDRPKVPKPETNLKSHVTSKFHSHNTS